MRTVGIIQEIRHHLQNHNTNDYAEASIHVLKDISLHKTKAYNVVALVDVILPIAGEEYFTLRILNHVQCTL